MRLSYLEIFKKMCGRDACEHGLVVMPDDVGLNDLEDLFQPQ